MEKKKLESHPIASLFPLMTEPELKALADDISLNGLKSKIVLLDGMILDGRNRHAACGLIDREFKTVEFQGKDPVAFVWSMNFHRRHLDASQAAMAAAKRANLGHGQKRADAPKGASGAVTQPDVAKEGGVSRRHVQRAKAILDSGDEELIAQVSGGQRKLTSAEGYLRKKAQRGKLEKVTRFAGKYRVIYADPPWKYGQVVEGYGAASTHYECMSLEDICDLADEGGRRVQDIAQDDAVLFLWTTAPLLRSAFEVVDAWGFEYKENIVWHKVRHNYGRYVSVRHEHLLLCTRGSCVPDSGKLVPSVQTIERTREHSEKPAQFRRIIDDMYLRPPNLPEGQNDRIELFARVRTGGWDVFGAEVGLTSAAARV